MGYFKDTVKGLSWIGSLRGVTRLIAFVKIALLARILEPEQFGIFAIASLALALLEILSETGINVILIQEKKSFEKYLNTAFFVSIVRGVLISSLLVIAAGPISIFFKSPASKEILYLISSVALLRGFINPSVVKYQKNLEFNKEFYLRFTLFFIDATVAVGLGYLTRSASSLVWGMMGAAVAEIIISWLFIDPRPKLKFEKENLRRIVSRGKWVTVSGLMNYVFHQGDDVVVGKIMNSASLGIYQVAYKLATLPIYETGEVFGKVTFPIYARISNDKKRLKAAFTKVTVLVSLMAIPVGILLFVFARQAIVLFLGPKWIEAESVVKVLAVFSIIRAISGSSTALFLAVKKQEYVTFVMLVSALGMILSVVPLVRNYGLVGAGISATIGSIFALPVVIFYLRKVFI